MIREENIYFDCEFVETGVPFDLATLSGKREKKGAQGKNHSTEKKPIVSKTRDEQKRQKSKKSEQTDNQDSQLKSAVPDQRTAGWRYR